MSSNLHACRDCGRQVSPRASSCPHCGAPIKKQWRPMKQFMFGLWITGLPLGLILLPFNRDLALVLFFLGIPALVFFLFLSVDSIFNRT
ncbi:MAG: hypothetical protein WBB28_09350 [Crinalium sp.]